MPRISKIFVAAGVVNIAAVLVGSQGFTSDYLTELQPAVFSWLGLVSIMLWGAAYMAVSRRYERVPALLAVFFVEKLVYFGAWLGWILEPPVPLAEVFQSSMIVGVWFATYGLVDLAFGLFFLWVLIQVRKGAGDEPQPAAAPRPARSDAVTLLAVLQREARFVDFVQEPIDAYPDAQIGAAVRDVHKGCRAVLDRVLALAPVLEDAESSQVTVPAGADPNRYRMVGNVTGEPPVSGTLTHHGWRATRCELPEWTGAEESMLIVAPAEVELR